MDPLPARMPLLVPRRPTGPTADGSHARGVPVGRVGPNGPGRDSARSTILAEERVTAPQSAPTGRDGDRRRNHGPRPRLHPPLRRIRHRGRADRGRQDRWTGRDVPVIVGRGGAGPGRVRRHRRRLPPRAGGGGGTRTAARRARRTGPGRPRRPRRAVRPGPGHRLRRRPAAGPGRRDPRRLPAPAGRVRGGCRPGRAVVGHRRGPADGELRRPAGDASSTSGARRSCSRPAGGASPACSPTAPSTTGSTRGSTSSRWRCRSRS